MKDISNKELYELVKQHELWLKTDGKEGEKLILKCQRFVGANLEGANLAKAEITLTLFKFCNLHLTNFSECNLRGSSFLMSEVSKANFTQANLHFAELNLCNLNLTTFYRAVGDFGIHDNSSEHFAMDVDFSTVDGETNIYMRCPSHGAFVAWKRCGDALIKLLIPEDAKRLSSGFGNKCRSDKAEVLEIWDIRRQKYINSAMSVFNGGILYEVGKTVYSDSFDNNRWDICTHGIHFFIDRSQAERWV